MICSPAVFFQEPLAAAIRTGGRSGCCAIWPQQYSQSVCILHDPDHPTGNGIHCLLLGRVQVSGPDAYPANCVRHRGGTIQRHTPVPQGHGISVAHGIDEVLAAGETGRSLTSGMSHQFFHGLSDLSLAPVHDADLGTVAKYFSPVVGYPYHRTGKSGKHLCQFPLQLAL